jgi:hypothetical protein
MHVTRAKRDLPTPRPEPAPRHKRAVVSFDVDGRGIAILATSARPQALAVAAQIARTVEVQHHA